MGTKAIPLMGILMVKTDGIGNPDHAKSCIVVLSNHKQTERNARLRLACLLYM